MLDRLQKATCERLEKFGVGEPSAFEDAAIMIRSLFRTDQSGQDLRHTTSDISTNIEILPRTVYIIGSPFILVGDSDDETMT